MPTDVCMIINTSQLFFYTRLLVLLLCFVLVMMVMMMTHVDSTWARMLLVHIGESFPWEKVNGKTSVRSLIQGI